MIIQDNFYSQTSLVSLIKMHTIEFYISSHVWKGSMRIFFVIEIKLLSFFSELASSIIMLFLLTPQIKNTLLLSRQITTLATAEHAHFMAYVKHLLKQHTYAYASLAKQMSRLHCATTMTSHTRTHVNTTTTSVRRKKNPV